MMTEDKFEHGHDHEPAHEFLSGNEVSLIVEQVFEKLSPETRAHLADSNVVLTMAGFKPQTEFFVDTKDAEEDEVLKKDIEKLNGLVAEISPEMRFRIVGEPVGRWLDVRAGTKIRTQMVNLLNLRGFERVSKMSKIPGVCSFDAASGWEEWERWYKNMFAEWKKAVDFDNLPKEEQDNLLHSIFVGFQKGYPDIATQDFYEWLKSGKKLKIQYSKIPFVGLYSEAQPQYDFFPEHANDESIVQNVADAGKILKEFYGSDFHKKYEASLATHRSGWAFDENGTKSYPRPKLENK